MNSQQIMAFLPLILIFVVFYFLIIRPQQKQQKERMAMLSRLKKGDRVVTVGGLHGSIVDLTEDRVTLKVNENTRLVFERSAINSLLNDEQAEGKKEKSESKSKKGEQEKKADKQEDSQAKRTDESKAEAAEKKEQETAGSEKK